MVIVRPKRGAFSVTCKWYMVWQKLQILEDCSAAYSGSPKLGTAIPRRSRSRTMVEGCLAKIGKDDDVVVVCWVKKKYINLINLKCPWTKLQTWSLFKCSIQCIWHGRPQCQIVVSLVVIRKSWECNLNTYDAQPSFSPLSGLCSLLL
jgi:hypothetical protein